MNTLFNFIYENNLNITIFIVIFVAITLLFQIIGIDLNAPEPEKKLVQIVTLETMDTMESINPTAPKNPFDSENSADIKDIETKRDINMDLSIEKEFKELNLSPHNSFCEQVKGNGKKRQEECSLLTKKNCESTSCCVFANGKCAAGSSEGVLFKTDKEGKNINADTYYYMGKCYGQDC
jgi:hypothetical protein